MEPAQLRRAVGPERGSAAVPERTTGPAPTQPATRQPMPSRTAAYRWKHAADRFGKGEPLDGALAARFGTVYGADLSGVRVHRDQAATLGGARAMTLGDDVAFAPGQFQPGTAAGDRLIAHELAHVVQQRRGSATPQHADGPLTPDAAERQARAAGMTAATGAAVRLDPVRPGAQGDDEPLPRATAASVLTARARWSLWTAMVDPNRQSATDLLWESMLTDAGQLAELGVVADEVRLSEVLDTLDRVSVQVGGRPLGLVSAGALAHSVLSWRTEGEMLLPAYGTSRYLDLVGGAIGHFLAVTLSDPATDVVTEVGVVRQQLAELTATWGDPYGLLELELEGLLLALVARREAFDAEQDPKRRAVLGAELGSKARLALLLGDRLRELEETWEAGEEPPVAFGETALARHFDILTGTIVELREHSATEEATLEQLGPGPEQISTRDVSVARPVRSVVPGVPSLIDALGWASQAVPITPDEAFPLATDELTANLTIDLALRVDQLGSEVERLRGILIPTTYSLPEAIAAHTRWLQFFSPGERDRDPLYRNFNKLYTGVFGAFGYGGVQGGAGRGLLMSIFADRMPLGGVSTDFAAEVTRVTPQRRAEVSGTLDEARYEYATLLSGGNVAGVGPATEAESRRLAGAVRARAGRRALDVVEKRAGAAGEVTAHRPGFFGSTVGSELRRPPEQIGAAGPHTAAAAAGAGLVRADQLPAVFTLLSGEQQVGWHYLLSAPPEEPFDKAWLHEQRAVGPATAEYLLAVRQLAHSLTVAHHPTAGPPGQQVRIGDVATQQGGLRAATGTSAARYLQGALAPGPAEDVEDAQELVRSWEETGFRRPDRPPEEAALAGCSPT